jgi:hypothetical protein
MKSRTFITKSLAVYIRLLLEIEIFKNIEMLRELRVSTTPVEEILYAWITTYGLN